jgi:hypothetical protein
MEIKGWTLEELADKLETSKNTAQKRIEREKIKPLFNGTIYPPDTYEKIKNAKVGHPKKSASSEAPKKPRNTSKNGS